MPTFNLTALERFPVGTDVDAYPRTTDTVPASFGASAEQQEMAADGATFTELDSGRYWFVGDNGAVLAATVGADVNPPPWLTGQEVPVVTGGTATAAVQSVIDALVELGLVTDETTL